jgi:hypothetical protein
MKLTRAAELVANHGQETLTYFVFPSNHWRQIKTNNPLERIIRDPPPNARRGCLPGRSQFECDAPPRTINNGGCFCALRV